MIYNVSYNHAGLAIAFMVAILVKFRYHATLVNKNFRILVRTTLLAMVMELCMGFAISYASVIPRRLGYFIITVFFVCSQVNMDAYYHYAVSYVRGNAKPRKSIQIINTMVAFSVYIMLIVNWFVPFVFRYNDGTGDVFERQGTYLVAYLIPLYYCFNAVYVCLHGREKLTRRQLLGILHYALFMMLGIIIQGVFLPYTFFAYFCSSIALVIMLLSLETPDYEKLMLTMEELKEAKKQADVASKSKSRFLANMSHEIRTPITAVLGLDEMIIRETAESDIKRYALDIRAAGNALLGIINDILDFSRVESGKLEIIETDYHVPSLLNDLTNMVSARAQKKGLSFSVDVPKDFPTLLHGDEVRVRQVITNLLTNAVKYTKEGSVWMKFTYEKTDEHHIAMKVSVKDTGIGIKKEHIEDVFQPFERVEEMQNRYIEGNGLGISITCQLLEMMGSKLELETEYGKGSEFFFTLNQTVLDWEGVGDYVETYRKAMMEETAYQESFSSKTARILVVDDVAMNLAVVKGLLKRTGMQIDTAESGREALQYAYENVYDVILLDHMMPEMDGIDTAKHIHEDEQSKNKEIPLIALTANAVSGSREFYTANGFDNYIPKPIVPEELENVLLHYLPKDKVVAGQGSEEKEAGEELSKEESEILSKLRSISSIDTAEGIAASGSLKTYLQVSEEFYDTIGESVSRLKRLYEKRDLENYTIQVHALKTTTRLLGALELSNLSLRLEMAGKNVDLDFIDEKTQVLLDGCEEMEKMLAPIFEKDDAGLPEIDEDTFANAIQTIAECERNFDTDLAEQVFDRLSGYRMSDALRPTYRKLKSMLADVARDDIINLVENWCKERRSMDE